MPRVSYTIDISPALRTLREDLLGSGDLGLTGTMPTPSKSFLLASLFGRLESRRIFLKASINEHFKRCWSDTTSRGSNDLAAGCET